MSPSDLRFWPLSRVQSQEMPWGWIQQHQSDSPGSALCSVRQSGQIEWAMPHPRLVFLVGGHGRLTINGIPTEPSDLDCIEAPAHFSIHVEPHRGQMMKLLVVRGPEQAPL